VFVDDDLATLVITLVGLASQWRHLLSGLCITLNDVLVNMNDSFHFVSFLFYFELADKLPNGFTKKVQLGINITTLYLLDKGYDFHLTTLNGLGDYVPLRSRQSD
jgi:hypothetical protein